MNMEQKIPTTNLGKEFNQMEIPDFVEFLEERYKADPSAHFVIVADWVDINKVRATKAMLEVYGARYNIDSITIKATRKQYEEDVNAFESGVNWEEIKE